MLIHELLLHTTTTTPLGSSTAGALVAATGKEYLWGPRQAATVDVVVIHAMSAEERVPDDPFNLESIIRLFCEYGVSAHYLITRRGSVIRFVPEVFKAWHCGGSIMPEPDNRIAVNDFSIGIELLGIRTGKYTGAQYQSLCRLCAGIEKTAGRVMTYVGHDQIAGARAVGLGLRNESKWDPGAQFEWDRFHRLLGEIRIQNSASCLST
jgi:N-acetyl-anhydromuramyl-L-alanine amidase AmpD